MFSPMALIINGEQIDDEIIEAEFRRNLPFALAVARSAPDPDDPVTVFEMLTFRSTGSGDVRFSLERPLPTDATTMFDFTADMRIRRLDGTAESTTDMTMTYDAKLHVSEDRGGRTR